MTQCCTAAFIGLLFTRFWLVSALYAVWWLIDREKPSKGGRRIQLLRNCVVWRYMRDYFPITKSGLVSSDKESASYVLQKPEGGNLLAIIVGGAQEALDAHPGSFTLLLKNRKGFVRLAIQNG
ncbi:hypothetical protein IHE44_0005912 [Lamprotornis superbus]|uniref:Uncharacterized protein n=1 Tax=Lamprotornis superbus TaxID=245042 RepID=A0A835NX68_9PASS|nr:hypothetical protein IHE44_0005912 [Lamprotornis superbus]